MDAVKVTRSRLTGLTVYAIPFRAAAEAMMTLASNPSAPRSASSPSRTPVAGIDAPSPCPLCRAGGGFSPNPRRTDKCRPRESKFVRTEGQIIDILGHRTGGHNALARNVGLAYSLGGHPVLRLGRHGRWPRPLRRQPPIERHQEQQPCQSRPSWIVLRDCWNHGFVEPACRAVIDILDPP
jgi:hypothetical protein